MPLAVFGGLTVQGSGGGQVRVVAVTALAALVSACGGGGSPHAKQTAPAPTRVIATIGQSVLTARGNTVTAITYEDPAAGAPTAPAGQRYVATQVKACAGKTRADVTPAQFRLLFADRRLVDADVNDVVRRPDLHDTTLAPGGCVTGWVSFVVPAKDKPVYVVLTGSSLVGWRVT